MSAAFQMLCPKYSGLLTPTTHMATLNVFTEWKMSLINNQNERSGGGVVDNTLDYQSRGRKIDPPLLRSFG